MHPFLKGLQEQRKGALVAEAGAKLAELVQAVVNTNRKGSITIKLSVEPSGKTQSECVIISDDVTVKLPLVSKPTSMFFVGDNGELSRNDPRQAELALSTVPKPQTEPEPLNHIG